MANNDVTVRQRPVYITGHKNPDTDSVCAAITYANLKNKIYGDNYIACRAGRLNEETQFVLSYFDVDEPPYIKDVRARLRDIDFRQVDAANPGDPIKDAGTRMYDSNVTTLCVTENEKVVGTITMSDIVETYMQIRDPEFLAKSEAYVGSIVEALDGALIVGDSEKRITSGRVVIATSETNLSHIETSTINDGKESSTINDGKETSTIIDGKEISTGGENKTKSAISEGDVVIVAENEAIEKVIESKASCIIICGVGASIPSSVIDTAKERGMQLITTPHELFIAANLITQSIPVGHVMNREVPMSFKLDDFLDDVRESMASVRYKYFPVLDRFGRYIGMVSHRNLLGASKKQLILVDHNEKSQAVKGLEEAEIVEIIDHHRLGSIESSGPIFFRNQPLGSTCTIIYQMYKENGVEIDKTTAGLMVSAILSDTLILRSPTCTEVDKVAARELSKIAGIDYENYGREMFRAGAKLDEKSADEIIHLDYKIFTVDGQTIGIGQVNSMSEDELDIIREKVAPQLDETRENDKLDMIFLMLTNITERSSDIIYAGDKALTTLKRAFGQDAKDGVVRLPGVVSRKKQFLLNLVETIHA
ncbi:MAG: putative manganese-dependent inorganic diphosphatase [Lachnospiraceae bacterium]|nr:putative manganese-dependent inorganic diphosphatase [Lachnospiraceae bacterium]